MKRTCRVFVTSHAGSSLRSSPARGPAKSLSVSDLRCFRSFKPFNEYVLPLTMSINLWQLRLHIPTVRSSGNLQGAGNFGHMESAIVLAASKGISHPVISRQR